MRTRRPLLASFLAFELRRVLRSPGVLVWTLAFPVVFYLVNFANKTNNPSAERWAGTTWAIYFMVSMCAWAAISAASNAGGARLSAERASGWTTHLRLTPLPSWAYAAGKVLIGAALALLAVLTLSLIAGAAARPQLPASAWAAMILACWLGSLPFAALGILVGLAAGTSVAQAAMVGTTLVLDVLGGLLVPLPVFPDWLQDIAKVLPTYRLADLGRAAVTRHALNPADMAFLAAWTLLFGTTAAWRYRADQQRRAVL
jgi:ABC-2 type transport system permease protein